MADTLAAARRAAARAGVTRIADLSGLGPYGVPVFQAVRPVGRLFSVAQGKGLTPMAAQVSALLEAVETDCAERLLPEGIRHPLTALAPAARRLWSDPARGPLAISLDPGRARPWMRGRDLLSGDPVPIPWDLLSLDTTRARPADAQPSSLGLATGNDEAEALAGGVAELLEHALDADFDGLPPVAKWRRGLDLASVSHPHVAPLLRRLRDRGVSLRIWSLGQEHRLAAFRCVIIDPGCHGTAPPVAGTGCHPDRTIALVRAVLEAVQSRVTMIAGAREDLRPAHYRDCRAKTERLLLGTLAFGAGPLPWHDVPHSSAREAGEALDLLLAACSRVTTCPVVAFTHPAPDAALSVAHCFAPALHDLGRVEDAPPFAAPTQPRITAEPRRSRRPVLFVGPTLGPSDVPAGIERRPPAVCGDIAALIDDPPPAVGLIDGCFEMGPTVWHKELLDLLSCGVPVLGAASLGAIRAAELAPFGMTGIGTVYEAYRDGRIARDDAVMLCHAPAELDHRAISLALVDAEAALDQARLPPRVDRALRRIVRTTDFRERTWSICLARYEERHGSLAPVDATMLAALSDLKRRDALALVAALTNTCSGRPRPRPPLSTHYSALLATLRPVPVRDRR